MCAVPYVCASQIGDGSKPKRGLGVLSARGSDCKFKDLCDRTQHEDSLKIKILESSFLHSSVGKYQHYLHGSGLLGSEKQWL
jgi:hypothetical protein